MFTRRKEKNATLSPDTPPPAPCPPSYGSINSFYKRLLHSLSTLCNIQGRQTQLRLFCEEEGRSEKTLKDSLMKTAVMNRDTCSHLLKLGSLIVLLIFMSNRKSQVPNVNTYVHLYSSHWILRFALSDLIFVVLVIALYYNVLEVFWKDSL